MLKVSLSAPWVTFVHEIDALFEMDPEIQTQYDNEENVYKLFVDNSKKAEALSQLLPTEKSFGNITLKIEVIPSNLEMNGPELIEEAFKGNPILSFVKTGNTPFGTVSYAVFQKKVAQFFNDQMDDLYGNKSMLYQDIAKDVLIPQDGVYYSTDVV